MGSRPEYLKMVFHLQTESDPETIQTPGGTLRSVNPVFGPGEVDGNVVIEKTIEIVDKLGLEIQFAVDGKNVSLKSLRRKIAQKPYWPPQGCHK